MVVPALIVLAASALALAVLVWIRARRRGRALPLRRLRRAIPLRYPVLLIHGMFGFDKIRVGRRVHEYFRGVPRRLHREGVDVHVVQLAPVAGIAVRAKQLAERIEAMPSKRVNIVAHSMGGLDARYAITRLGLSKRVASLTTIGTPHRGTPLADLGTELLGERLGLRKMCEALGIGVDAFYDVTSSRMTAFNREVEDASGVTYASIVGVAKGGVMQLSAALVPGYLYLSQTAGPNDGLVTAESQRWGQIIEEIDADHWAQIGWSRRFDASRMYEDLVRRLSDWGL
jgi:triacylglycerol lipase